MEAVEAARTSDPERQAKALAGLERAKERCACVGGLLLILALERGGLVVQRKLGKVFGGLPAGAWEKAVKAEARAAEALAEVDALKQRLRELEQRLGISTGGKQPVRRVCGRVG